MSLRLLDCTLRDSRYYNNWEFQDRREIMYLKLKRSNIDVVEIESNFSEQLFWKIWLYEKKI